MMSRLTSPSAQRERTTTRCEQPVTAGVIPVWLATIGGMTVLVVVTAPAPILVTIVIGLVVVALLLMALYRATTRDAGAAHGLASLVVSGLGLLVAVLLAIPGGIAEAQPQPTRLHSDHVEASATAGPSVEGDLRSPVTYEAEHVIDGKANTAWRVGGDGIGQTLTFRFNRKVHLSKIGLIPGYAKTDPFNGANRFWENRRVSTGTYTFDNGASVDVRFRDTPDMQRFDVNADTTSVELKITGSTPEKTKRDFTAISEVEFDGWPIDGPPQTSPPANPLRWVSYGLVAGVGLAVGAVVCLAALAVVSRRWSRRRPGSDAGGRQSGGTPTAPSPASSHPGSSADDRAPTSQWLKDRVVDNLGILLTTLGGFVATSVLAPFQRFGRWWLVVAAIFAIGAVLVALSLLRSAAPPVRMKWLAGGLVACVGVTLAAGWAFRPDLVRHDSDATLLLLDTSQAMSGRLNDGVVKLDAAKRRLKATTTTIGVYEELGLATYGVDDCLDREPYHLRMPISAAGTSRVDRAVADLHAEGRSNNLAAAAQKALGLLRPFSKLRRLVIFTATPNTCPDYDLNAVIQEAQRTGVDVEWDIVGLGLEHPLSVDQGDRVRVLYANTEAEVGDIVGQLLGVEPATHQFDELQKYIDDQVRPEINAAVGAVYARDPAGASAHLEGLTKLFKKGEDQFDRKPIHTPIAECEAVAEFERAQFHLMREALPLLEDRVKFDREHPGELSDELTRERKAQVDALDTKVKAYNARLSNLDGLVEQCLHALSKPR
jgi:hypothetical protein